MPCLTSHYLNSYSSNPPVSQFSTHLVICQSSACFSTSDTKRLCENFYSPHNHTANHIIV